MGLSDPTKDEAAQEIASLRERLAELEAEGRALREENAALREKQQAEQSERARAEQALRERIEQLHGLYKLGETTILAGRIEEIYVAALAALKDTLGADRAAVLLLDVDGVMRFHALTGLSEEYRRATEGHSPWDPDDADPQPVLVTSWREAPDLLPLAPVLEAEGIASLGFIPLVSRGRLLGKLMVYYDRPHHFTEEQTELLRTVATHIALSIDRKRSEDDLRRAKERLKTVISHSPVILFAFDKNGVFTLCQGKGLDALGIGPDELVGQSVLELASGEPEILAVLRRALRGEAFTALIHTREGVWLESRYNPIIGPNGELAGVIGVSTDVTERRRAEEELRFLFEASSALAGSIDYPTTLANVARLWVPRLADWCAVYLMDDQRPRKAAVYHPDLAKAELMHALQKKLPIGLYPGHPVLTVLGSGEALIDNDLSDEVLRAQSMDEEHLALLRGLGARARMIVPMRGRGQILGAIALYRGGPERRYGDKELRDAEELSRRAALAIDNARLYHEAQEAVRAREEILSIASHEIRSPLNTLHLQIQILRRAGHKGILTTVSEERLASMLENCDRQLRRLSELINKLFDMTRITTGKILLHLEDVDLCSVVREVSGRLNEDLQRAGCELSLDLCDGAIGRWDRLRLDQVLTNLLGNAAKYGAGRPLSIRVEAEPKLVRMVVADQGIGIAKEHHEEIFERYARVATESLKSGLGLGLYIVRRILETMRGSIRVESQLGAGSTFVVELPRDMGG